MRPPAVPLQPPADRVSNPAPKPPLRLGTPASQSRIGGCERSGAGRSGHRSASVARAAALARVFSLGSPATCTGAPAITTSAPASSSGVASAVDTARAPCPNPSAIASATAYSRLETLTDTKELPSRRRPYQRVALLLQAL